jgi:hypothetical protein
VPVLKKEYYSNLVYKKVSKRTILANLSKHAYNFTNRILGNERDLWHGCDVEREAQLESCSTPLISQVGPLAIADMDLRGIASA